jgi:hypothetical protein
MVHRFGIQVAALTATLATGLAPHTASAALGEPEASVQSDVTQFRGSIKSSMRLGFRMHEIQTSAGTVVHEFVGSDGNVFAVSWKGPMMPNLKLTLGRYFDQYASAPRAAVRDHRHLQIRQENLVVLAHAHLRDYSGVAYLPQSLPGGVTVGDLQ